MTPPFNLSELDSLLITHPMRFFNRVTLQTPESVELEFTLAGIGSRAHGLIVDYLLWSGILLFFLVILAIFSLALTGVDSAQLWLGAIGILGFFTIYVGYFVFFETLWRGQTPGKRYAKIRVIRDDGRSIGLAQATLRALLRPLDDAMFIGAFLIILTKQEKRLGDWVAGTIVVQEERPATTTALKVSPAAQSLATTLLESSHLTLLQPDDFAVVREYLQRRAAMELNARAALGLQLAQQVKERLRLDDGVLPETTADLFLGAVYLAYQQQFQER